MRFICIGSILFLFGFVTTVKGMDIDRPRPMEKLELAPEFTLEDLEGNSIFLSDFQNKKVVLISFWATWCPYCRKEIPLLKKIYKLYRGKDVEILAINIKERHSTVTKFKEKEKIPYTILLDTDSGVASQYRVMGVPTDIIIDKEGRIRYYGLGWPENIEELINEVLMD